MLHFDYTWDLSPNGILLDKELNTDRLNWKAGDYFQIQEVDGIKMFKRVDPLIQFILEGKENGRS
jgi:hypothetical protein